MGTDLRNSYRLRRNLMILELIGSRARSSNLATPFCPKKFQLKMPLVAQVLRLNKFWSSRAPLHAIESEHCGYGSKEMLWESEYDWYSAGGGGLKRLRSLWISSTALTTEERVMWIYSFLFPRAAISDIVFVFQWAGVFQSSISANLSDLVA